MPTINFSEKELEDFLCRDNNLEKYLGLKFHARQVRTPVGIIDILAYGPRWVEADPDYYVDRRYRQWFIIELKKEKIDTDAYFQAMRYKHFFNSCRNSCGSRTYIPLLIGNGLENKLDFVVNKFEPKQQVYYKHGIFYTCFSFDFETSISFNYISPSQRRIEQCEIYQDEET